MNLTKLNEKINFDITEGEDEIVNKLIDSYNINTPEEFVYKNRKYLDQISEQRIDQFIEIIGKKNLFILEDLYPCFIKRIN